MFCYNFLCTYILIITSTTMIFCTLTVVLSFSGLSLQAATPYVALYMIVLASENTSRSSKEALLAVVSVLLHN